MKKHLISIAALLVLFCPATFTQVGIKGGVNMSSIAAEADDIEEKNAILGWQAGLMLTVPVHDWFSIQPEVLYIRKGSKHEFLGSDVEFRLDYIEVPVLAMLKPGGGPVVLEVGPQFSYLANAKTTFKNGPFGEDITVDEDRDNYEPLDVGVVLGIGLSFEKFLFDLRYTRGFNSIDKARTIGNTEYSSGARNFNLQASIGVYF